MAGKKFRKGIGIIELLELFPDEETARNWFEGIRWPDGRTCARCGGTQTREVPNAKPMPYWCTDCRKYFSVKVGTVMESSKIPLRKWAIAFYQMTTNLKGVSSLKLHRDLNISQTSAWFMGHRIRQAMDGDDPVFSGPVEADETYVGGKEANKHESQKKKQGRGTVGKAPVAGVKDRKTGKVSVGAVDKVDGLTMRQFVHQRTEPTATVYTDEAAVYHGLKRLHGTVAHGVGEYVNGMVHTNGMESFWSMLKRGYVGVYHHMSGKHLGRYVTEFEDRHNHRQQDTLAQMADLVRGAVGKRLKYADLIAEPPMTHSGQLFLA